MSDFPADTAAGDRLAKVIARSGLCSRRDAEGWIKDGRVTVNGKKVLTPAFNVAEKDKIKVDGEPLAARQGTRVWLYHKPAGLVVTEKDPEGRETIFERLTEKGLPRVVSIGRLDINTEGLLLLTNDGGLKRVLELPATGWLRRYRVRAFGAVTQAQLDGIKDGIEIEGIQYGPIEAILERTQGSNVWLVLGLREGKNREVKNVLGALGLQVNRLIRVSYGPFQLGDLNEGAVEVVPARVLRDQLGKRLAAEAGADFESEMPEIAQTKQRAVNPKLRAAAPGKELPKSSPRGEKRFRFEDDETERLKKEMEAEVRPRKDRPGRPETFAPRPAKPLPPEGHSRKVFFEDGTEKEIKVRPPRRDRADGDAAAPRSGFGDKRPGGFSRDGDARPPRKFDDKPKAFGEKRPYGDKKSFGDKPAYAGKKAFGDKPKSFVSKSYGDKSFGDKPARGPRSDASDRPKRAYGDKPQAFGDKPKRDFSARPSRDGADRPARSSGGDRKPYAPRDAGDRPARAFGDKKPYSARPPREGGDRPARPYGDKPAGARPPRDGADRPARAYGDKPKTYGDKKPFGDKKAYGDKKPYADKKPYTGQPSTSSRSLKPYGAKPAGGRPTGAGRPAGGKPAGDKPRGPRKPRP